MRPTLSPRQWIAMLCVPVVALVVVGRQLYLSKNYGLSTWKGGGMGMFAAADEVSNRYVKVFLVEPDRTTDPLVQFSADDNEMLTRALEYPTRSNFLRAAKKIAQENWIPAYQKRPVLKVNSDGNPTGAGDKTYRVMVPSEIRSDRETRRPNMEMQYWNLRYDPALRRVRAVLVNTFVFTPEELLQPDKDPKRL
jgi:hypothetical protein